MLTRFRRRVSVGKSLVFAGLASLAVLLGVPARAFETQFMQSNAYDQVEFTMPSGNIGCIYTPAGGTPVYQTWDGQAEIQCDRVEPDYVRAVLGSTGEGFLVEPGDQGCCGGSQRFNYDHVVTLGPFQCLSATNGLTCARSDGHGFFLSRALIQAK